MGLVGQAVDLIESHTIKSARDPREPGRKRKQKAEDKVAAAIRRHWRAQAKQVTGWLDVYYPGRKATVELPAHLWNDDEFEAELARILVAAAQDGVTLFDEQVDVTLDYSAVNTQAAATARKQAGKLMQSIDDATRAALKAAVAAFVETPGMTLGDVIDALPFDAGRAARVATSEITAAYADAGQAAGEAMQAEFPDVSVVKGWNTNNDDRVCIICEPLDGTEVAIDENFDDDNDIENPPAHPSCRCWTTVRTRIND